MGKYSFTLFLFLCYACKPSGDGGLGRFEFQHPSMGSLFNVVAYADDSLQLAGVVEKVFQELDSLNLIMSDYIPHSELMKLSRTSGKGEYVQVSGELYDILKLSKSWYEWSNGLFDVTIGPYSQLWRRAKRQGILPPDERLEEARKVVGFEYVAFDQNRGILLKREKMQLDLGGIAKGYAVDHIFDRLTQSGYPSSLVDGGGDLRVGTAPPGEPGWKVSIQNHIGKDSTLILADQSVATSGDFYRSLEINGKKYSHIISPFTGYGITGARAVTVITSDCTTADVLASIFSIAGPDDHVLNEKVPENTEILIYEKEDEETSVYLIRGKMNTR